MDSFGTWRKWEINIFFPLNAEFYRIVWTINALFTVRSEMLPFSGNNQKIKIVRSPPEHFAIGYVHNGNLRLGNIALQLSCQTIAGRSDSVFWWFPALSEDQDFFLSNSPKLSCGLNTNYSIFSWTVDLVFRMYDICSRDPAPMINSNVERNPNLNPNPKPNLTPYPNQNQKPNH